MAYEKECDVALKAIAEGDGYYYGKRYEDVNLNSPTWMGEHESDLEPYRQEMLKHSNMKHAVFAILRAEGLIEYGSKEMMDSTKYFLTDKGKAFLATDSFVDRAKRWDLANKLQEQNYKLGTVELWLKQKTFWISVAALFISIVAAYFSVKQYQLDQQQAVKDYQQGRKLSNEVDSPTR